jgi:hypothetical protein
MVKIKTLDRTATIKNGVWKTEDPNLLIILDGYLPLYGVSGADPHPDLTLANKVITDFGGEVLEASPVEYVEGRIY